jgi:hypothetical protein
MFQRYSARKLVELVKYFGEDNLNEIFLTGPTGTVATDTFYNSGVESLGEPESGLLITGAHASNPFGIGGGFLDGDRWKRLRENILLRFRRWGTSVPSGPGTERGQD